MKLKFERYLLLAAVIVLAMAVVPIMTQAQEYRPVLDMTWGQAKIIYLDRPDTTAAASLTVAKPGAQLNAMSYPAWYKELPVPWLSQFSIPGSNTATKSCGQTCGAMIDGYYKRYQPSASTIIGVNNWLNQQFPGLGYATPNSYYTNVLAPRYALTRLIQNYFGYASYYERGATEANLSRIFRCINAGYPVIVCVEISGGVVVPWDATDHWVVLLGFNQGNGGEVIMHNPGTADGTVGGKGKFHHMSIANFMRSWSSAGGYWMPVTYPMCVFF